MTVTEGVRVAVVSAIAATIYVSAIKTLIAYKRGQPINKGWKAKVVLSLAGLGLICAGYAYFVEPRWLSVSRITITSSKLPPGTRPIRIAHISDLHSEARPNLEDHLADVITQEKPDVIAFTGDSINTPEGLPTFRAFMSRLSQIAPTFAVRGNWDVFTFSELDLYGNTGAQLLDEAKAKIDVRGTPVWLSGITLGANYHQAGTIRMARLVQSVPSNEFSIFLYHNPDFMEKAVQNNVDLYLAGHTHGGQVALPFYGALVTYSIYGKRFESGLYHQNNTYLYVNRGIGMTGNYAPRVRFWARPELTMIEVAPTKD